MLPRPVRHADEDMYPVSQKVLMKGPPGMHNVADLETLQVDGAVTSFWLPTKEEIHLLLEGGSVELTILGIGMPPVMLGVIPNG